MTVLLSQYRVPPPPPRAILVRPDEKEMGEFTRKYPVLVPDPPDRRRLLRINIGVLLAQVVFLVGMVSVVASPLLLGVWLVDNADVLFVASSYFESQTVPYTP